MNNISFRQILIISTILISLKLDSQCIYTFAGNGTLGYSGDGGQAGSAQLYDPKGITIDAAGNIYMTESSHHVRKISVGGIITTIAGGGPNNNGDGGPAIQGQLNTPTGIAIDAIGNIYVADYNSQRIRIITPSGNINTFAGGGSSQADGVAATSAGLSYPNGVAVDQLGNVYISDYAHAKIRMVNQSGIINTIAGTGVGTYSGDGGLATLADINGPVGITVDNSGNVYFADSYNNRIRKISNTGIITTVAGNGVGGFSGDGGLAVNAQINYPQGVAIDASGNIFITDWSNNRIRKVDVSGVITTYAGTGAWGATGDNGPASLATMAQPFGVTADPSGNIYFSDASNNKLRKVSPIGCVTGINKNSLTNEEISISPNPNNGYFNFQSNIDIKLGKLILLNSLGQKVYDQQILYGTNNIKTNGLPTGLYNYCLFQDDQLITVGKLIID